MRVCDEGDRALLREWTVRFTDDIGDPIPKDQAESRGEQMAGGLIDERRGWLWINERGEPCAMGAHVRINFVFTPRDQRGRGYASNLVAALSREQLRAGATFCSLFTDLLNPTSNSIYQKIGYRPIADFDSWKLTARPDTQVR
jgi:predicted acetyltransferase